MGLIQSGKSISLAGTYKGTRFKAPILDISQDVIVDLPDGVSASDAGPVVVVDVFKGRGNLVLRSGAKVQIGVVEGPGQIIYDNDNSYVRRTFPEDESVKKEVKPVNDDEKDEVGLEVIARNTSEIANKFPSKLEIVYPYINRAIEVIFKDNSELINKLKKIKDSLNDK